LFLVREVELDAVGVVEEEAVGSAASFASAHREHERYGGVDVLEGSGVSRRRVHVPEDLVRVRFLKAAGPLAAPEIPFALLAPLVQPYRIPQRRREGTCPRSLYDAHPELLIVGGELCP
jgi:hypothetical protein